MFKSTFVLFTHDGLSCLICRYWRRGCVACRSHHGAAAAPESNPEDPAPAADTEVLG